MKTESVIINDELSFLFYKDENFDFVVVNFQTVNILMNKPEGKRFFDILTADHLLVKGEVKKTTNFEISYENDQFVIRYLGWQCEMYFEECKQLLEVYNYQKSHWYI